MADTVPDDDRRVLLLTGSFQVRGRSAGTLRLAKRLSSHGFTPTVICHDASRLADRQRREMLVVEYPFLNKPVIGKVVRRLVARDLQETIPALVHVQTRDLLKTGLWLARRWACPLVLAMHDALRPEETLNFDPRWGRRILAVSDSVRDSLVEHSAVSPEQIVVIPAGVAPPHVSEMAEVLDPDHVPVVGTAGPLEAVKGMPYLLDAAQQVLATGRDVEFLVAGAGPEESSLRRLAHELKIAGRTTFIPNLSDFRIPLAAMDIFCLPSLQQGLGTIMLEAMSLGRPVIASAVGGVYSVVRDNETGLVVPPRDSGVLARRILELLDAPVHARAIGAAARRVVNEEFGVERMVERTATLYRKVLDEWDTRESSEA